MTLLDPRQSSVIVKAIVHDGRLYQMEYKEHKNTLLLTLLLLYKKGISEEQMLKVYASLIESMGPLLMPKITKISLSLNVENWQDFLGDRDMYSSYLEFFDRQMVVGGIQNTLDKFFYNSPLAFSIGSQRLPTVHLALGVEHGLPEVIGHALSYMAAFYQDTSFLLEQSRELRDSRYLTAREIMLEQVKVDPRFGSFPSTPYLGYGQQHESKITYHKILKNSRELLRTYVYLWKLPKDVTEALNELRILAAHMMMFQKKNHGLPGKHKLDLCGGTLLSSLNAIDTLYPNHTYPFYLIQIQFLNLILSYIAQGRPDIVMYSSSHDHQNHHSRVECDTFIQKQLSKQEFSETNVKAIIAMSALDEAQRKTDKSSIFNKVMSCY